MVDIILALTEDFNYGGHADFFMDLCLGQLDEYRRDGDAGWLV